MRIKIGCVEARSTLTLERGGQGCPRSDSLRFKNYKYNAPIKFSAKNYRDYSPTKK